MRFVASSLWVFVLISCGSPPASTVDEHGESTASTGPSATAPASTSVGDTTSGGDATSDTAGTSGRNASSGAATDSSTGGPAGSPPVYVTVAGHIEDLAAYTDCAFYGPRRAQLLEFADTLANYPVHFNLQVSYEWFRGVLDCDTPALMRETNGRNIIDFLVEEHGFEIDVHQEGASVQHATSGNNFADIRFLGGEVTAHMSETTGFQWDNPMQYTALQNGEQGLLHPEFTFAPSVLAGGASVDHVNGDFSRDMTSIGVLIPSGFTETEFHEHDDSTNARMVYVGSGPNQFCADWGPSQGCHFENTADFVGVVAMYLAQGRFDSTKIHTTTLFVPQAILFAPERHEELTSILDDMSPLIATGAAEYAHFSEVVEIWRDDFDSEPNVVRYDAISPADYTCVR